MIYQENAMMSWGASWRLELNPLKDGSILYYSCTRCASACSIHQAFDRIKESKDISPKVA